MFLALAVAQVMGGKAVMGGTATMGTPPSGPVTLGIMVGGVCTANGTGFAQSGTITYDSLGFPSAGATVINNETQANCVL